MTLYDDKYHGRLLPNIMFSCINPNSPLQAISSTVGSIPPLHRKLSVTISLAFFAVIPSAFLASSTQASR